MMSNIRVGRGFKIAPDMGIKRHSPTYTLFAKFTLVGLWPSPPETFHILIRNFSYFVIRLLNHIFFVINFSYFVIRFLINSSIVKSENEIGKVTDEIYII